MAKLKVENQRRQKVLTAYGKELVSHFFLAVVDQARSQGGCKRAQLHPPTGCKVLAGYEYYSLYCAIYTYINKNCHVHECM